jgi:glutamine amidotransferase PdxT
VLTSGALQVKVAVLALQGDVSEHAQALADLGADAV